MKERDVNFFRPLWRRVGVTAVCVIWAGLELWHGEQLWVFITLGLTAYAVWSFFIAFPKDLAAVETGDVTSVETKEGGDVPPQA